MLKDLFKGSAIYGIAPFIPKILTIVLLPVLTQYLTSTDYGIIGTITSITFAVQALQDLGLKTLLPNYFYKCRAQYKVMWREVYGFLSIWMVLFALIQGVLLYFLIPAEAVSNRWTIIILSNFSTVFFGPTAIIGQMYYQLNLKPTPVAIRAVFSGVTTILVNFICVVVFRWGYLGAYVGSFAGTFLANLTYWPVVNRKLGLSPIFNFKWRSIKSWLKISMPTIPHYYSAYLMHSSNVVAMNVYKKPQSEIGQLTMSQNISGIFETVFNAINQVWSPMAYRYIRDKNVNEMKRILYVYIIATFSMTFIYSLWSREIYGFLIKNAEIAATYKYSIILVMALNYRPTYVYFCNYLFYHERTVQLLKISFVSGLICCSIYFSLIPYWGVYAALIGFYVGCLYFGYSGYFNRYYKEKTIYHFKWYMWLPVQLSLTVVSYLCVDLHLLPKLIVSIFFLTVMLCLFTSKVSNVFRYVKASEKVSSFLLRRKDKVS